MYHRIDIVPTLRIAIEIEVRGSVEAPEVVGAFEAFGFWVVVRDSEGASCDLEVVLGEVVVVVAVFEVALMLFIEDDAELVFEDSVEVARGGVVADDKDETEIKPRMESFMVNRS